MCCRVPLCLRVIELICRAGKHHLPRTPQGLLALAVLDMSSCRLGKPDGSWVGFGSPGGVRWEAELPNRRALVPAELGQLKNLQQLDLSSNQLTGV